jgi:hypothetical protein
MNFVLSWKALYGWPPDLAAQQLELKDFFSGYAKATNERATVPLNANQISPCSVTRITVQLSQSVLATKLTLIHHVHHDGHQDSRSHAGRYRPGMAGL